MQISGKKSKQLSASYLNYRLGVGVLLFNAKGLIFAGERKDTKQAWQMPQGGIDPDENPAIAVARELYEETGITPKHVEWLQESNDWFSYDLPPNLRHKLWNGRYVGQKQKWFLARFLGQDQDVNIRAHYPYEFSDWNWLNANELIQQAVAFKRPLYDQVFAEFLPLLEQQLKK